MTSLNHIPYHWKNGSKGRKIWLKRYAMQKELCAICEKQVPATKMTKDHVIPKSKGGGTDWNNIQLVCSKCNQRKGNKLPSVKHKFMLE